MPDPKKIKALSDAMAKIRKAQQTLMQASRKEIDPTLIQNIRMEYQHLDSVLAQMLQTMAIADDAAFKGATNSLKQCAKALAIEKNYLVSIINDVQLAANIVGYIAQATALIAKL